MDGEFAVDRRQFLTAATVSGMVLLAGCGSGGGNNGNSTGTATPAVTTHSGPADFRATLTGPSKITLGKPFRLTLDVTNIGGQSGSLDTNVQVTEGRSTLSRGFPRTSIDSGESVTMRTEPIQFNIADTYTFSVEMSELSHTVTVQPKTGTLGTSFDLSKKLQATVKNIGFRPAVLYSPSHSEQTYLQKPASKSLLAVVRVAIENVGAEVATLDSGAFHLKNGTMHRTLGGGATPLTAAKISGKPLSDRRLSPAEQRTGWLLGEIPRSKARKAVTIIYQRDTSRTPPEIQWTDTPNQGTRALPQFSVKNFQLPKTAVQGQDVNASVTVSNEGNNTRTFRGMVQYRSGNSGDWRGFRPITTKIKPGKSIQQNITINSSSKGSITYRLAPFETTQTVEYAPPTFAFGESYTTTQNVKTTVSDLQSAKSVVVKNPGVPKQRVTPSSGERFVLVWVKSETIGESEGAPFASGFSLRSKSQTFSKADDVSYPLVKPVDGGLYAGYYDPDVGETYTGYLVWSVPQQVALRDLTVEWTSQEPSTGAQGETARWTKGGQTSR